VTWSELEAANAPVYRQAYSILLDQDLTHPFDTLGTPRAFAAYLAPFRPLAVQGGPTCTVT
jgi:hypothetical protein